MNIGIEAQRIFRKNKHGMDYVVLQEIKELQRMDTGEAPPAAGFRPDDDYYVFVKPGEDRCLESTPHVHIVELRCPSYPLWEQWALPRAVRRYGIQLLHATSNTAPLWCAAPLVLTLHDIIFLEPRDKQNHSLYQNLGWLYRRLVVPRILCKCRRIITVSHYERHNILERLHLPEEQVTVIYNGYNSWFRPLPDRYTPPGATPQDATPLGSTPRDGHEGYFFFLGNTDPKKNTERTLVAYARYLEQSAARRPLLMADLDEGYLNGILTRHHIEHIRPHLTMPGYIPNSELPHVYNRAFAFLYTSLRESFGIPLLEAMACGTPVVTSNTSSMPEIGGPEALLVNPESSDDIAAMMLRLENDPDCYRRQQAYGPERARHFAWRQTAEQLLTLYREVTVAAKQDA